MKKFYQRPLILSISMGNVLPIATSGDTPSMSVDDTKRVDASAVEAKQSSAYNVWDDDWSQ